jgi:hypothetical protein
MDVGVERPMSVLAPALIGLLLACTRNDDATPSGPASNIDVDTDTDATPPAPDDPPRLRAPLCDAPAAQPTISEATLAWHASLPGGNKPWVATARRDVLEAMTDFSGPEGRRLRYERGWYRLRDGENDSAITDFSTCVAEAATDPEARGACRKMLAVAWMRVAEVQHCLQAEGSTFCVSPTSGTIHADPTAMTTAADLLTTFLAEDDPNRSDIAWLLNLTALARGVWPEAVPEALRADPTRLSPPSTLPAWRDVGLSVGLTAIDIAGTPVLEDFDGNGFVDLLISDFDPLRRPKLWLQSADGSFCEATHATGLDEAGGGLFATAADYDNDGDPDLLFPRAGWYDTDGMVSALLFENDGSGRFLNVTAASGLAEQIGPSQVAVWADFNLDGWLDVFIGRESQTVNTPSSLYLNQGDGTFVDTAADYGLTLLQFVKGAAVGDVDGDGRPDLYVSAFTAANKLYLNRRVGFTPANIPEDPASSFASWFLDHDQDGDLDLYTASFGATFGGGDTVEGSARATGDGWSTWVLGRPTSVPVGALWRNDGGVLTDIGASLGLTTPHSTMGSSVGDLDADGWPDFVLGTGAPSYEALEPNAVYHNQGGAGFREVAAPLGLNHLQKGHGVAFGDLDGDGDEDLVMSIGGAYRGDGFEDPVYQNPTEGAASLSVRFRGTLDHRDARGAHLVVETDVRTFHAWVGINSSFSGNTLDVEQGLGASTTIEDAWVTWPNGDVESLPGLRIGARHVVEQGRGVIEVWPFTPRTLGGGALPASHAHDTATP